MIMMIMKISIRVFSCACFISTHWMLIIIIIIIIIIIVIIIIVYCRLFFGKPCISKEIKLSEVDSEVHSLRSVEIYLNTSHRKYCGSTSQNHSGVVIIGAKVY